MKRKGNMNRKCCTCKQNLRLKACLSQNCLLLQTWNWSTARRIAPPWRRRLRTLFSRPTLTGPRTGRRRRSWWRRGQRCRCRQNRPKKRHKCFVSLGRSLLGKGGVNDFVILVEPLMCHKYYLGILILYGNSKWICLTSSGGGVRVDSIFRSLTQCKFPSWD